MKINKYEATTTTYDTVLENQSIVGISTAGPVHYKLFTEDYQIPDSYKSIVLNKEQLEAFKLLIKEINN